MIPPPGAALLLALAPLPQSDEPPYSPHVEPASGEAAAAVERLALPEGLRLELFAAEPMLANPVCFYVDYSGDVYVAETFRHHAGVTDMRNHMDWLDQELANRTVEDRVEMLRRNVGERLDELYGTEHERVRLIRDTDGDGTADRALVFADGFKDYADGIGAGLLSRYGDVYYTCMPHLWRLRDRDGDGRAEERESLSHGYGVHVALLGHDLHGLRIGPDGRLYFSCGDRGFHVETEDGVLAHSHTGAVLRCNLDGSGLEVFATGLRNPQELVFDAYGNLFTGDNNSDGGDKARWVHVVEGAESGWRFAFQYVTWPDLRGPWNDEKLWHPWHPGQAAYVLPPVANLADGPSGLTYNPISNGDPAYAGHFFLCDFRGDPKNSGVHAFDVRPKGAGFELGEVERFVWGTLATDCDFGPGGSLYVSDWVAGWDKTGKGRLYRITGVNGAPDDRTRRWTREMLAQGLSARSVDELQAFLTREDLRLRQEAHLELAARGEAGVTALAEMTRYPHEIFPRLHAIWGLGIAARRDPVVLELVLELLEDPEPEVRAQAARVLGDERARVAVERLIAALQDPAPRVRMYAALALYRIGAPGATEPLLAFLRETGSGDPVLRHCGIMGLVGCAAPERLVSAAADESLDVRLAAVVALRRLAHPGLARFLADGDPLVVVEAARAIHDVPVADALPALAELVRDPEPAENALVRRVLNANFREGREANARALAAFAARADARRAHRVEALRMLGEWGHPPGRDKVLGDWRPLDPRPAGFLPELVAGLFEAMSAAPPRVTNAWLELVTRYDVREPVHELSTWVLDEGRSPSVRRQCFRTVEHFREPSFPSVLTRALQDRDGELRAAALEVLPTVSQAGAVPLLKRLALTGEIAEQRAAFRALARTRGDEARDALRELQSGYMRVGTMPEEVCLDFILALEAGVHPEFAAKMRTMIGSRRHFAGEVGDWYYCAFGGDAQRGERVFREKVELSCLRCHPAGADAERGVGPDLRGVGRRLSRRQILESIVLPNARIAPGYEAVLLRLADDELLSGRILDEDDERLHLIDADGEIVEVLVGDVEARRPDLSAMPEGLAQYLTQEEMRDLIEYVSGL